MHGLVAMVKGENDIAILEKIQNVVYGGVTEELLRRTATKYLKGVVRSKAFQGRDKESKFALQLHLTKSYNC